MFPWKAINSMTKQPATRTVSELEDHIGYWLRIVSNHVSEAFARALREANVSVAEWVAMRRIFDHSGITASELATQLAMTPGAVSKVIDKLQSKEWVACSSSPADKRVQLLSLTTDGENALPLLAALADANDREHFDCLDESEQDQLIGLMRKLANHHGWKNAPVE